MCLEASTIGVRQVAKAPPLATPNPVAAPAPPAVSPRPVAAAASSHRGSFTENRAAVRIGNSAPPHPAEALLRRFEGTTVLDVRVTPEGTVASATVCASSGYAILGDAAVTACLGCRYLPRLVDGVPAPDWLRRPFTWTVRQP